MKKAFALLFATLVIVAGCGDRKLSDETEEIFTMARENGKIVNEGFNRSLNFVKGWMTITDPETGLFPRNINDDASKDIWNAKDCAADNYPFMVLATQLLDQGMFTGRMREMLETEKKLTSRLGVLPDTYSFSKNGFANPDTVIGDIIFGSAEYVKDGLIPLYEWLGPSPWSERMISIVDDCWKYAPLETPFGNIISDNPEVNGDMLQSLSRIYWITGDRKYLDLAIRLGDYYLLGNNHPTRNFKVLRLRDHGCEIVSGLCELYAAVSHADKAKKDEYKQQVYEMLDRILEVGRNEDGLFYNSVDPVKGTPVDGRVADNFGYTLNGFYTVYMLDGIGKYREPVIRALDVLDGKYRNFAWEGQSQDGYADAIEGALNLYTREEVPSAKSWIDSEIRVLWGKQKENGIIEGWHGDGNFARTTIMYCLWKTGGAWLSPWREDLEIGGVWKDSTLYLTLTAKEDWNGSVMFDRERHREYLNMPEDWPRINQFPEYFTAHRDMSYTVMSGKRMKEKTVSGEELLKGYPVNLKGGETFNLIIR